MARLQRPPPGILRRHRFQMADDLPQQALAIDRVDRMQLGRQGIFRHAPPRPAVVQVEMDEAHAEPVARILLAVIDAAGAHPETHSRPQLDLACAQPHPAAAGPDQPEIEIVQPVRPGGLEAPARLAAHAAEGQAEGEARRRPVDGHGARRTRL